MVWLRGHCRLRALWLGLALTGWLYGPLPVSAAPMVIRFAHVVSPGTPKGLAVERFKTLLETRTQGRIQVVIHPQGRLYNDHNEIEALRLGAVEMLAPSLSKFGRIGFPEFEIFDLPFLFNSFDEVHRVTQGPLGRRLLARLQNRQMVGLGFLDNGFKHMSGPRPLLWPKDYLGMRMRVQSSKVIAEQMQALGAIPVVLDFSETRRALSRGVVDGTENPSSNFWTQGMQAVQTDLTLTRHAYLGYAFVVSAAFWQYLSEQDREDIAQSVAQALAWGNSIAARENQSALQALRADGRTQIHELSTAQKQAMREMVEPVYRSLARRIGQSWVKEAVKAVKAP